MQSHEPKPPGFQPQTSSRKANPFAPRSFEVTYPGQEIASSPTNPFPRRPHEVWMGEPTVARKPDAATPEESAQPELKPAKLDWSRVSLYAPGQTLPDPPRWAGIQTKLTVGQPNDAYEQEADRVAEQVMSMAPAATPTVQRQVEEEESEDIQTQPLAETITPLVQRQEMPEEEEPIQAKCETCEQEEPIQRTADGVPQAQPDLESRLNASQGGGSALPDEVRSFMEPRFGADFSQVRVHTGGEAVQMNQDLNAQAFTHKQDVYFSAGKAPANDALTAHELTHVVQQTGAVQTKQVSKQATVQLKCSACENEEAEVQRSPNISAVSKPGIQRWPFSDDDDKKEADNSSGGGVLDWAKEKASGAVDSVSQAGGDAVDWAKEKGGAAVDTVSQAGGDAVDWAKEKGGAAVDTVTQAGGQALDLISNWRNIQVDWNSESGMILKSWASKLEPGIVQSIVSKSPADLYNLIEVPDQVQQTAKGLARQMRMDIPPGPGFAPSPNIPIPDIDIPSIPDRQPSPTPNPTPNPPSEPSSPSPVLFLLLLAGIIIYLAILYYGSKEKKEKSEGAPGSGYSGGGGTSGGGGASGSFDDKKPEEDGKKGGCPGEKFDQEYLTAENLISESEGYRNKHGAGQGHMVRDHVDKKDIDLCNRACDPSRKTTAASTFINRPEADTHVQTILSSQRNNIKQWATDPGREIGDEKTFSVRQSNVGRVATCTDQPQKSCSFASGKGAILLLIFDPGWKVKRGCFWVLTGHPTK